jgi:hypothetical protein
MDAINADLDANGDSSALLKRLRAKEAEHATLTRKLATARLAEKHPKAASLSEARTLIDAAADEPTRLRLRQRSARPLSVCRCWSRRTARGGWPRCNSTSRPVRIGCTL